VDDLIKDGINPLAFRLLCFGAKYRSELVFSLEAVHGAARNLEYLYEFARNLPEEAAASSGDVGWTHEFHERFHDALNNDLNTPQAFAAVLEMVAEAYRRKEQKIWNTLKGFDSVLGLDLENHLAESHKAEFPAEIRKLRDEREQARAARDFKRADELRRQLDALGYEIRDSKAGPMLMRKRSAP
jgi:cysteinyl-tRNA synthetase